MKKLAIFLSLIIFSSNSFCQENQNKILKVDIAPFDPFVSFDNDKPTGFDIDFLKYVLDDIGYETKFRVVSFEKVFDGLKDGSADIAIGGISITGERAKNIVFSQPYFFTGKQILVKNGQDTRNIARYVSSIFINTNIPKIMFIFLCFVVISANIIWHLEKATNAGIEKDYIKGLFDATYFVVTTMATVGYGDISPKRRLTKLTVMILMLSGIAIFSWSISEFQAEIVKQKLDAGIENKADLKGLKVAVVKGTTSEKAVLKEGFSIVRVDDIRDAYFSLYTDEVKAVISDYSILNHYARTKGNGKVKVVGSLFGKESYGIAVKKNSEFLDALNIAILNMTLNEDESNAYETLIKKWALE